MKASPLPFVAHLFAACLLSSPLLAADADNDGLDDLWQQRYSIASFTGSADPDGDGRINLVESRNFSNPNKPDSNPLGIVMIRDLNPVDGLHDPWQAQFSITAAQKWDDPDGDGRTNLEESISKSHPFVADAPFSLVGVLTPAVERPGPDSFIARVPDSAQGRRYILEVSDTLLPGSWVTASMINNGSPYQWGTGDELSGEALTGNSPRKFFRWKIDDPDSDGDFLPDWMEMQLGTDVNVPDSDGDGIPDGNEYGADMDALAANTPENTTEVEKEGAIPTLQMARRFKYVSDTWQQLANQGQITFKQGSIEWETGPNGVQDRASNDVFASQYQDKLPGLSYPSGDPGWAGWQGVSNAVTAATDHGDFSDPINSVFAAHATHVKAILRTTNSAVPAPWKMPRNYVRVLKTSPFRSTGDTTYSNLGVEKLMIDKGSVVSTTTKLLEPDVMEAKSLHESLSEVAASSTSHPFSVDSISSTNLSFDPSPDTWVMLPQGEARQVVVNYGSTSTHAIYQLSGAGFDPQVPVPRSGSTLTLQSTGSGTAELRVGYSTTGNMGGAILTPQPVLRVGVYERQEVDLLVVPIAFMRVPGGLSTSPQYLPTQAALQSYLDDVYLRQCNVKVNVTYAPEVPVAWDIGLGPAMNDTLYRLNHDRVLQVTSPTTDTGDYMTAEENAILTAAPPKIDPNTVTLYYVITKGLVWVHWANAVDETNKELSKLVFRPVLGFAPGKPTRLPQSDSSAHIAWVADRQGASGDDARFIIAHELGHKLGLVHSTEQQKSNGEFNPAYLTNGDNENRLMTGRVGSKRAQGPRRLTHAEWVSIRQSKLLKGP